MSTPDERTPSGDGAAPEASAPKLSTAPAGGTAAPPRRRWHWSALPDHLGRARTSTVILAVLFLAIGTLYLNVRPDPTGTNPASGSNDVEAPAQPSEPAAPEPPEEPVPTGDPEGTDAPTTTRSPGSTTTPPSAPSGSTTAPGEPTGTSEPTTGTTAPGDSAPTTTTGP